MSYGGPTYAPQYGAPPPGFMSTIKCSQCGFDIPLNDMTEHVCGRQPDPGHTTPRDLSNPFTLRQWNASGRPAQPSPFSQPQDPRDTRFAPRHGTPPAGPPIRMGNRQAPPRINPDAANIPFLAPGGMPPSPWTPGGKNKLPRSMTSPMPRLWDLRPPSEEISANIDCAFPPFPPPIGTDSRPGSRSGSERGGSRAGSRPRKATLDREATKRSRSAGGDGANRPGAVSKPSMEMNRGRPSMESGETRSIDQQEPSLPKIMLAEPPPPRSSSASSIYSNFRRPSISNGDVPMPAMPTDDHPDVPPLPPLNSTIYGGHPERSPSPLTNTQERRQPPQRPSRPSETILPPQFLNRLDTEPIAMLPPSLAAGSPTLARSPPQHTPQHDGDHTMMTPFELARVSSAPAPHDEGDRPPLVPSSHSEPVVPRSLAIRKLSETDTEKHVAEQSATIVTAPEHHLPHEASFHVRSESNASSRSSVHSIGQGRSSNDSRSPAGSAASSFDTFSPLNYDATSYQEEIGLIVPSLNSKRNEPVDLQPNAAQNERVLSPQAPVSHAEPLPSPRPFAGNDNWPLESPVDPTLGLQQPGPPVEAGESAEQPLSIPPRGDSRSAPVAGQRQRPAALELNTNPPPMLSSGLPLDFPSPGGPMSPQRGRIGSPQQGSAPPGSRPPFAEGRTRAQTATGSRPPMPPMGGAPAPRSRTPQPMQRPQPGRQQTMPMPRPPPGGQGRGPPRGPGMPPGMSPGRRMPPPGARPMGPPDPNMRPPMGRPPPFQQQRPGPPGPMSPPQQGQPNELQNGQMPPRGQSLSRKPTTINGKPVCRGCGEQIEGKSVKAADGRLTGRWHKQCFVCRTCQEAFTTADFYVIENQPYCERHYHEKNGSLCRGCNHGIEGPYLETDSNGTPGRVHSKYHPRCFVCVECRTVLSDDYFEIGGRVFCERHALAAMRSQARAAGSSASSNSTGTLGPSNLRAERRTTRLIMT